MSINSKLKNIAFSMLFCLLGASCAHVGRDQQEIALSPSELNSNISNFSGKNVTVKGYVTLEPEGHNLYESKELKTEFARRWESDEKDFDPKKYIKYCLTIANPDFLYRRRESLAGKTLVVKGKFIGNYTGPNNFDIGACPLPTAIFIDEIVSKGV